MNVIGSLAHLHFLFLSKSAMVGSIKQCQQKHAKQNYKIEIDLST